MSQRDTVAQLLREHGGVDHYTARRHGVGQLRTRITELRQAGWRIDTTHPHIATGVSTAEVTYVLVQAPDEPPRQTTWLP